MPHLYVLFNQVYCHNILSAPRYNNIRIFLRGDAELLKSRLDQGCVLVEHMLQVSTSLFNVPKYTPAKDR